MIRLFNWFRRGSLERGLARELQYHFDRRVADLTTTGIPEAEARRRVAAELGLAQLREEVRDVWLTRWLRDFLYDLRYSARSLRHSPGFTAAVLLSFALGIGATTAIYSLVDQLILHALPVRQPERLVLVDWNADDLITGAICSSPQMPYPGFRGVDVGFVPAFWIPTSMYADANFGTDEDLFNGPERWLQILARLRPGVSAAQAQAGLLTWFRPWLEESARRPGFPSIAAEKRRLYLTSSLSLTPAPQRH